MKAVNTLNADNLDKLISKVTVGVIQKHDRILITIALYSINTKEPEVAKAREKATRIVMSHEHILRIHGFYSDKPEKTIRFDIIVSFNAPDRHKVY